METLKKTFLAMANDLRVIFVKLADRIHNIQTLEYHPNPSKREKRTWDHENLCPYCQETRIVILSIISLKIDLKVLHPGPFKEIFVSQKVFLVSEIKYTGGVKIITTLLQREGIRDFEVKWRIKSPYRVYEKLEHRYQSQDIGSVSGFIGIWGPNQKCCWLLYGLGYRAQIYYTPLIKKIKDYIAVPKFNGYQSIHTTVLVNVSFPYWDTDQNPWNGRCCWIFRCSSSFCLCWKIFCESSLQQTEWIKDYKIL